MKIGSSLALICIGAILAFAVTTNTSVFNLHTAGWVIMLVGLIGLLLPARTAGWLGRRLLVRRTYPGGRVEQIPVPPYVARNPGVSALERGIPSRPTLLDQDDDLIDEAETGYVIEESEVPAPGPRATQPRPASPDEPARTRPSGTSAAPGDAAAKSAGVTEVIEDLYEEP